MTAARKFNLDQNIQKPVQSRFRYIHSDLQPENEGEVLFQKIGNKWYAFSPGGDVFFLESEH